MRPFATTVLLTLAFVSAGCKSDAERQMAEMTDKQKEIVSILRSVTDTESAKAANVKIKAVAKDVEAILQRSKTTQTSPADRTKLAEQYKPQQEQITKDAQAELQRIAKIPGASMELMEGLMQLSTAGLRAGASK